LRAGLRALIPSDQEDQIRREQNRGRGSSGYVRDRLIQPELFCISWRFSPISHTAVQ
jgi:hypothetical protein